MRPYLSGRAAGRAARNAQRLRGVGWTRAWRKGRTKRQRPKEVQDAEADDQG